MSKVHTPNFPLRPIRSLIVPYCHDIAKFLIFLHLSFFIIKYILTDSFSFAQERIISIFNTNYVITASFDVKSLFTNIALDETINCIVNRCFSTSCIFHGFTRQNYIKRPTIAVKNGIFLWKVVYSKRRGGNGLSTWSLACQNLSFQQRSWLAECNLDFKPLLFQGYVDDCFLLF